MWHSTISKWTRGHWRLAWVSLFYLYIYVLQLLYDYHYSQLIDLVIDVRVSRDWTPFDIIYFPIETKNSTDFCFQGQRHYVNEAPNNLLSLSRSPSSQIINLSDSAPLVNEKSKQLPAFDPIKWSYVEWVSQIVGIRHWLMMDWWSSGFEVFEVWKFWATHFGDVNQ